MQDYNVILWSGGRDSTATVILAHELGIKIDLILMARLWFDKERGIPAENDAHLNWVFNVAKPMFESWGFPVELVSSEKDYLYSFYHVVQNSPNQLYNGNFSGFLIAGKCRMCSFKTEPLNKKTRELRKQYNLIQYCGIRKDEPLRLEKMHKRKNQISLLEKEDMFIYDVDSLCRKYGLLSPDYDGMRKRGGNCWFCPNSSIMELVELKQKRPDLWQELKKLSLVKNTVSRGFKYGIPFDEIERQVDYYIGHVPEQKKFMI